MDPLHSTVLLPMAALTSSSGISPGREMDLGKPGDVDKTDAIGGAKESNKTEVVTLLERFKENPEETRHAMRLELG